ncbi:MAG: hypothetical protein RL398_1097 [Planctomycetota bacterium]|jgi:catechol 2,3-dioxygenase-like lactoylglutathione lyase family enzyme
MVQPTESGTAGSLGRAKGPALGILAVAPRPGAVLQGCCPPLTAAEAGALQTAWLKLVAQELPGAAVLLFGTPPDAMPMLKYFAGPGVELRPWPAMPNGGEAMLAAAAALLAEGYGPVLVRTADAPDVTERDLKNCLGAVRDDGLLLAPDQRGHVWLLGAYDAAALAALGSAATMVAKRRGPWRRTVRQADDLTALLYERSRDAAGAPSLGVRDLQSALQFYEVVLAAELLHRDERGATVRFWGHDLRLKARGDEFVPNGLCLPVDDVVVCRDGLGAHQVVAPGDDLATDIDGVAGFVVTDPFGNRLYCRARGHA